MEEAHAARSQDVPKLVKVEGIVINTVVATNALYPIARKSDKNEASVPYMADLTTVWLLIVPTWLELRVIVNAISKNYKLLC